MVACKSSPVSTSQIQARQSHPAVRTWFTFWYFTNCTLFDIPKQTCRNYININFILQLPCLFFPFFFQNPLQEWYDISLICVGIIATVPDIRYGLNLIKSVGRIHCPKIRQPSVPFWFVPQKVSQPSWIGYPKSDCTLWVALIIEFL